MHEQSHTPCRPCLDWLLPARFILTAGLRLGDVCDQQLGEWTPLLSNALGGGQAGDRVLTWLIAMRDALTCRHHHHGQETLATSVFSSW